MDQLAPILTAVKKHYFWVVVGVVVVLGSAVAVQATSKLGGEAKSRSAAIDNAFKSVEEIAREQGLANQQVVELIRKKTALLKENVLAAWQRLYEEQKRNCKLPDEFGEQFKKEFMEAYPDARKEISLALRESYGNFIQKRLEQLEAIIDVLREREKPAEGGGQPKTIPGLGIPSPGGERDDFGGGFGGGLGRAVEKKPGREQKQEMIGMVEWNPGDRQRIKDRFTWRGAPTTREVLLAQEDLWVYQALLTVIKNTNEGAQRHDKAYVKRIEALDIGRDATQRFGRDTRGSYSPSGLGPASNLPGTLPSGEVDGFSQPGAAPAAPAFPSAGPSDSAPATGKLTGREMQMLTGRYVDANGEPLSAEAAHPYAEFKMMPIYMRLRIDQRRIPRLLAECANSTMPIEIKVIEFQPGRGRHFDLASLERKSSEDSQGGGGFAGFGSSPGTGRTSSGYDTPEESEVSYDVTLDLKGIIYIFNPPDPAVFGTGTASQAQPGAEGQPPQAQPETPAPPAQPEGPAQPAAPAQPSAPGSQPQQTPPDAATPAAPGGAGPSAKPEGASPPAAQASN